MIRKSRLIKFTFGSCFAIFLFLQFLDYPKEAPVEVPVTPSGHAPPASVASEVAALSVVNTQQAIKHVNLSSSPIPTKGKKEVEVSDEVVKEPRSSLSGERIHGLPNETVSSNGGSNGGQGSLEISKILTQIKQINDEQSIKNEDIFGPVTNNTVVIAVQVHNRLQYLRQLIISLSQATGIDQTLLIFSHDFWDEGINDLVNSVDFAKTMQIFYPFSIQTHPHEFPGESPNDCPRNAKKDQAQRLKCLNADWPDLYGHYREAKFTQTKHHWWWKANTIFDHLRVTKHHEGMVLFLEEDHYVSDDFLHVLNLVDLERASRYPNCDIICLGTYLKSYNYKRDQKTVSKSGTDHGVPGFVAKPGGGGRPMPSRHVSALTAANQRRLLWAPSAILSSVIDAFRKEYHLWPGGPTYAKRQRVEIMPWESAKHNMGMAFKRALWRKIHSCKEYFCNFDDYNWDWSLQHLSKQCFKSKLEVMLVKGPRVFHIGECGVHHKKRKCEAGTVVKKVQDILSKAKSFMFPTELRVMRATPKKSKSQKNSKGNGGWGDHRDRALCLNMAATPLRNKNSTQNNPAVIT